MVVVVDSVVVTRLGAVVDELAGVGETSVVGDVEDVGDDDPSVEVLEDENGVVIDVVDELGVVLGRGTVVEGESGLVVSGTTTPGTVIVCSGGGRTRM